MKTQTLFLALAAMLGGLGVVLGAFAAHGLKARLSPEMLAIFETGVKYHMYHALALLALSAGAPALWSSKWAILAASSWFAGVLIFSGSLYVLAVTEMRWLGAITPVGGVFMVLGWISTVAAALSTRGR